MLWKGRVLDDHGASNSTDFVIIIKHNVHIKTVKEVNIILDRGTLLRVEYDSIHYSLVIVYSSNNDDVEFLKKAFLKTLGRDHDDFVILSSDWNTVLDNKNKT